MKDKIPKDKTIQDFGEQWKRYRDNDGYYGSEVLLADIFGPLLDVQTLKGLHVADIGSGTGRIVSMLLEAGVSHVTAVEPSEAMHVLETRTADDSDKITYIHDVGAEVPLNDFDLVVSFGVLHHIEDPSPTVGRVFQALRPGGRFVVWLYGKEGNAFYLFVAGILRTVTTVLPDNLLNGLSVLLNWVLSGYGFLCRFLPLPLQRYMLNHFMKLDRTARVLTIFDQLNPAYAKYYTRDEARRLLEDHGFKEVQLYHRHGYSWTVSGVRA